MIVPAEEVIESMDHCGRYCLDVILMYIYYEDSVYVSYADYAQYQLHKDGEGFDLPMEVGVYMGLEDGGFMINDIEDDALFLKIAKFFDSVFDRVIPMELLL